MSSKELALVAVDVSPLGWGRTSGVPTTTDVLARALFSSYGDDVIAIDASLQRVSSAAVPEGLAVEHRLFLARPEPVRWLFGKWRLAKPESYVAVHPTRTLRFRGIRNIVVINDLIWLKFPAWSAEVGADTTYPRALSSADRIVVPSRSTEADLRECFPEASPRVTVIPWACDPVYESANSEVEDHHGAVFKEQSFVLAVGAPQRRKNIGTIIRAMDHVWKRRPETRLLIAGGGHAGSMAADPRVVVLPRMTTAELSALYKRAICLVYPSLYEGFGMPVVEALTAGCPVITSRNSSLPEVGGAAALYCEPLNSYGMAEAILHICSLEPGARVDLVRIGQHHARAFSWLKFVGMWTEVVSEEYSRARAAP